MYLLCRSCDLDVRATQRIIKKSLCCSSHQSSSQRFSTAMTASTCVAIDPDDPGRECFSRDERVLRDFVAHYLPQGSVPTMALRACMFTNTPHEHFILDRHPDSSRVLIASACSGHGFKFCSVVGGDHGGPCGKGPDPP